MAFLDWIRQRKAQREPEPDNEPEPPRHHSAKGNPITQQWQSDWHSGDDGLHEFRHHVGRSVEGYHGGLEVSFRGGEQSFSWSKKRPTAEAAQRASYGMRQAWELGDQRSERSITNEKRRFAEWRQDYQMAKERCETGKEPECRPIPTIETGKSKAAKTPAKRVKVRSRDIPF